jgi:glycosyltransferase involved in cell wall biosynthesis
MIEAVAPGRKPVLCMDARLLGSAGTGVSAYAAAMQAALASDGTPPLLLHDRSTGRFAERDTAVTRLRRALRATGRDEPALERSGQGLWAPDLFRLAQARFRRTGRLLTLRPPIGGGVMHWTYPVPLRMAGWWNVYTVHDVVPLVAPELSAIDGAALARQLHAVTQAADAILTVSAAARDEIVARLALPPARVVDAGSAVTDLDGADAALPAGLAEGGYYLFCGTLERRKNLPRLADAWAASGSARPLVLAGPDGDCAGVLRARGDLVIPGYQPRRTLMRWMRGARALLFPSLAEGFGLPVAEAMALGTPVLTADRGALAEVAGDAALRVDPEDAAAIAAAIRRLDGDDALCAALAERGRARAQRFTPEAFGARLRAFHAQLIAQSPPRPYRGAVEGD